MSGGYVYSDLELKLRAECEEGLVIGPSYQPHPVGPGGARAPTGEYYTEFSNPSRSAAADETEAFALALAIFRDYARQHLGTLYWRVYPEIDGGRFYMRLLISSKPVLASEKELI